MTPVAKFLKTAAEKAFGTFAEGEEAPKRVRQIVELFARANPQATVAEWIEFAAEHAASAYQQGYVRGFERSERLGPEWEHPDEAAAILDHLNEVALGNEQAYDPNKVVPLDGVPEEYAARQARAMDELVKGYHGKRRGPAR